MQPEAADDVKDHIPPTPAYSRTRRYVIVMAAVMAIVLSNLDNLIIGVAMPAIVGELGGLNRLAWVVTAYTVAMAVATPLWGKIGDMYGRKGATMTSIAVFLLGSALCGMAQDIWQLIGFRGLQGIGAGGLMVGAQAIIATVTPPREQGRAQGLGAIAIGAATVAGPLVGGLITEHLGWRWAFYINLPLGLVTVVVLAVFLRAPLQGVAGRIDFRGALLLVVGVAAIILITSWGGNEYSWGSPLILGLTVLTAAVLTLFFTVERRAANPVLPLSIFGNRSFSLVTVIGFLLGFVMFSGTTYLPVYLQTVQGVSPSGSGVMLLPLFLGMIATGAVAGNLMSRTGKYKIFMLGGAAICALGTLFLSQLTPDIPSYVPVAGMALFGIGIGALLQTSMIVAMQSVEPANLGVAAGTASLVRTIGGSIGVSIMGALFTARVSGAVEESAQPAGETMQLGPEQLAELAKPAREAYESAVASGTGAIFLVGTFISVAAFAVAWFIRETPLRATAIADEEAAAEQVGSNERGGLSK